MAEDWRRQSLVWLLCVAYMAAPSYVMANRPYRGNDERPLFMTAHAQKRDATVCPASYSLCPASFSGGCCPTDLSCGTSSCYPTIASAVQCSVSGYTACDLDQGGGCCPSGYSCARNGCIPPAGTSYTQNCGTGSYLCPSSVGYGCCHNSMACGFGYCYATSFSSVPVTITFTTTISDSITQTITTVVQTAYTESVPQPAASSAAASSTIAKFTPSATAIAKVEATDDSPGSGLTGAQLGGIIGAAVVVVLVVCVATFLIIRRLNAVTRAAKAAAARKSGSASNTRSSSRPHHDPSGSAGYPGIENMSVDPLMMSDSDTNAAYSTVGLPRPSAVHSSRGDLELGSTPPIPAPYGSPQAYISGYQQVPMSEPHYSDSSGNPQHRSTNSPGRHRSTDSSDRSSSPLSAGTAGTAGYFDIDPALRDQNLRFGRTSRRPSVKSHGRQWSDASDISQQSASSSGIIELDAGPDSGQRSGSSTPRATIRGTGFTRISGRKQSSDATSRRASSGSVATLSSRRDTGAAPGMSGRLENVQESEFDYRPVGGTRSPSEGGSERGSSTPQTRTSHFYEMGIASKSLSAVELERLEQQKVIGNLGDLKGPVAGSKS